MSDPRYPDDIDDALPGYSSDPLTGLELPPSLGPELAVSDVDTLVDDDFALDFDDPGEHVGPESIELEKIPRRLWEQALAPLHRQTRAYLAGRVPDEHLQAAAWEVVTELNNAEYARRDNRRAARRRATREGAPLPSPGPAHATARPTLQVNIRLRADDHARLVRAAQSVGIPPTTLARALVLNGAAQVLRDSGAT